MSSLHLGDNDISEIKYHFSYNSVIPENVPNKITLLNLINNKISNWKDIRNLEYFNNLESLWLSNNILPDLIEYLYSLIFRDIPYLPALSTLTLDYNNIAVADSLLNFSKMAPKLTNLRMQKTPLTNSLGPLESRFVFIGVN